MKLTYFAEARGGGGLVKIGSAYNVRARLRTLRRTMPGVRLLAVTDEPRDIYERGFSRSRVLSAGWYSPTPDLLQIVERLEPATEGLLRRQAREGLSRFGEWLEERGISRKDAAEQIGITPAYVTMIASGSHSPGTKLGMKIYGWVRTVDPTSTMRLEDLFDD